MKNDSGPPTLLRSGIDIGGTFTDLIMVDCTTGEFVIGKSLTTPEDPSEAIESVLTAASKRLGRPLTQLDAIVHGTTLVTNALIQRKGDRTALLTTRGFRDSVEIGRESRYDLYDLLIDKPEPLVPRYLRFDVPERTLADGRILEPLDVEFVERLTKELEASGIVAIAVTFLNSFANPATEQLARETILRVAPQMRVSLSSEVTPSIREFERTSTTIANVYVQARVEQYIRDLESRLRRLEFKGNFSLMLSSGGIATPATAIAFPVRLLESGPAAGALAAASYGAACGYPDLVSFDMGGTTAKFCVIEDGKPHIAHEFEFDRIYRFRKGSGLPATIPVIEMVEIGAGGGSIARVNSLGLLKVGPDSAGASPGPICYGRGAIEPTVTDADLVLGYLDPAFFLGGQMQLDIPATYSGIEQRLATKLGLSLEKTAWGIHQIVNETMASAARAHVIERGKDPQRQPLFAFGGCGPVHGYRIAKALGSPSMIVPLGAGIVSTVGFLSAPTSFDFVRPWRAELATIDWEHACGLLDQMSADGRELLLASGVPESDIRVLYSVDMRYVGQGFEIVVPLPDLLLAVAERYDALLDSFKSAYQQVYGRSGPPVPAEIINWRTTVTGPKPEVRLRIPDTGTGPAQKGVRRAYFPELDGYAEVPVYDRYAMPRGFTFQGPALVEERESTTVIGPDGRCRIDEQWNLVVDLR
jgi:N-methylhydantoinase A